MKQTAKYIIEKSLDIASISNSDNISYSDKVQLLNDTFTQLYQWSINAGEKNWVKEVELVGNGGKYKLPSDFWQLEQVYMNDAEYFGAYEIINGYIHIKQINGNCKLRYYTKPPYLSIPNNKVDIECDFIGNVTHANNHYIATVEEETGKKTYRVYDLEKNEKLAEKTVEFTDPDWAGEMCFIYKDCFYYLTGDGTNITVHVVNFNGSEVYSVTELAENIGFTAFFPVLDFVVRTDRQLSTLYNRILFALPEGFEYSQDDLYCYRENIETIYYYSANEEKAYIIDVDQQTMTEYPNSLSTTDNIFLAEMAYINDKLTLFFIRGDGMERIIVVDPCSEHPEYYYEQIDSDKLTNGIFSLKVNPKNGYGFISVNKDKSIELFSYVLDTEFNAPNNMFYSLLIYKLAQAYNTKLNVENSRLDETVMEMEHTYFDTLKTNISKYGVIKDVYERRSVI